MSGTGASIGYSQKGGFEAGIDILGANAFNWNETAGLTANTNWAVDYKRAQKREEIEEKKQKKALELAEGKDKFVKDWKEKHPGNDNLSDDDVFAAYQKEKKEKGEEKKGSREGILDHVAGFFTDNFTNYGGSDGQGWVDEKGEFHANTCFVAGTKIHTQIGLKNIEDVQIGDVVLSWNEVTGKREYKRVTELFVHEVELLFQVHIQRPHDLSLESLVDVTILETTWNHPFWVIEKKAWVETKDLEEGDRVLLSNGKEVAINRIEPYHVDATKVYNFEVEDNHTYFVGEDGVLVHNYAETPWDAFSMAMGFVALDEAYKERDGFGVVLAGTAIVVDGAAFLLPVVPGGAGFLVKAGRTGKGLINNAEEVGKFTKSNLKLGQQMHAAYKADLHNPAKGLYKEYNGIKGIRPDFVDFNTKTIYELKPNNPRQINEGTKQLEMYKEKFKQKYGGEWNTVLDKY
jgi:hypothetical protein